MKTMKPAGTQHDKGLGFEGSEVVKPAKVSRDLHKNQWSGHLNDGRLVQMDQQPNRRGNDGSCHHAGYEKSGKMPPVAGMTKKNANPDAQRYGTQHRGGGREFMPSAGQNYRGDPDRQNVGRGPTKGNQQ